MKLYRECLLFFVMISVCISGFSRTIHDDISSGKIPLPSDAEVFSGPHPSRGYTTVTGFAMYTTSLKPRQVIKFYNRELPKIGWQNPQSFSQVFKEHNLPVKNKIVSGVNVNMGRLLKNIIYFHSNGRTLMLMVVPPKGNYFTKTVFSLSYVNALAAQEGGSYQPKSFPNDIPIYPGAELFSAAGNIHVYTASDDISNVAGFYQQNMLTYGWNLDSETPLTPVQVQAPAVAVGGENSSCSSCSGGGGASAGLASQFKGVYMLKQKSEFSKEDGEKCTITLFQSQSSSLSKVTQISIEYYGGS